MLIMVRLVDLKCLDFIIIITIIIIIIYLYFERVLFSITNILHSWVLHQLQNLLLVSKKVLIYFQLLTKYLNNLWLFLHWPKWLKISNT